MDVLARSARVMDESRDDVALCVCDAWIHVDDRVMMCLVLCWFGVMHRYMEAGSPRGHFPHGRTFAEEELRTDAHVDMCDAAALGLEEGPVSKRRSRTGELEHNADIREQMRLHLVLWSSLSVVGILLGFKEVFERWKKPSLTHGSPKRSAVPVVSPYTDLRRPHSPPGGADFWTQDLDHCGASVVVSAPGPEFGPVGGGTGSIMDPVEQPVKFMGRPKKRLRLGSEVEECEGEGVGVGVDADRVVEGMYGMDQRPMWYMPSIPTFCLMFNVKRNQVIFFGDLMNLISHWDKMPKTLEEVVRKDGVKPSPSPRVNLLTVLLKGHEFEDEQKKKYVSCLIFFNFFLYNKHPCLFFVYADTSTFVTGNKTG